MPGSQGCDNAPHFTGLRQRPLLRVGPNESRLSPSARGPGLKTRSGLQRCLLLSLATTLPLSSSFRPMDPDHLLAISADAHLSHNNGLGSLDTDNLLAMSAEARLSHTDRLGSSADISIADMSDVFVYVRCP